MTSTSTEPKPCAPVAFDDLEMAYSHVEMGADEARAYLDRRTGRIYCVSPDVPAGDAPEDLGEPGFYTAIPGKFKLDLGRAVIDDFVE